MTHETLKEHQGIKESITDEVIRKIETSPDPFTAADYLSEYDVPHACAVIDKMSPLSAAIVLSVIKMKAAHPGEKRDFYRLLVARCAYLDIDAVKGCGYARDQTYKLTGIFLP